MSTVANFSDLDLSKSYTYADYLKWTFEERVELIKGIIKKMSPAPSRMHQIVSKNLFFKLQTFLENQTCQLFYAPFDVRLPVPSKKKDITVVQPDICVVCDESKLDELGCNGSPDLIVEIISPNNSKHDTVTKYNLYEEAGVLEYWIVDPMNRMVLVYILENGKYRGLHPFGEDMIIESHAIKGLKVAVNDVFNKI
jgi:Uma2 family endonuclease